MYTFQVPVGTVKAHTSFGDFLKLLVEAISKLQLTPEKVSKFPFVASTFLRRQKPQANRLARRLNVFFNVFRCHLG